MNVYIYDSFVNDRKNKQTVAKIETRITDLGLNGKIVRLGVMNSVFDIIDNEAKKGAKTFVAVGNMRLLNLCINALATLARQNSAYRDLPLGFIPVGKKDNDIASFLGLDLEEEACAYLSARRIQSLDLGLVNGDKYFLTSASISTKYSVVEIDANYSIEITQPGQISAVNLPFNLEIPPAAEFNAQDGRLELFIEEHSSYFFENKNRKTSVFSFNSLKITNPKLPLILDGCFELATPAYLSAAAEKINLIVGKHRGF